VFVAANAAFGFCEQTYAVNQRDAKFKIMRNLIGYVGLVSIIALTLAACQQSVGATPPPPPPPTPPSPPTPPPPPSGTFNITVQYRSKEVESNIGYRYFVTRRWEEIIAGDLPDVNQTIDPAKDCNLTGFQPVSSVDDVIIFVDVQPIDGNDGVLANTGICGARVTANKEPITSIAAFIVFDLADFPPYVSQCGPPNPPCDRPFPLLTNEKVNRVDIAEHEIGHALGFGLFWKGRPDLLEGGGAAGACGVAPRFTGVTAMKEYTKLGGLGTAPQPAGQVAPTALSTVPVEGSAGASGPGGCDVHWRETVFGSELMTPYIDESPATNLDPNKRLPISAVTTAAMYDLGYTVNNYGDPFTLSAIGNTLPLGVPVKIGEQLTGPRIGFLGTQRIPLR
jgi:hypothetical protein